MEEKTINLRPPLLLPVLIALILGGSFVIGKKIEVRSEPAIISVSGEGKVSAVPDIASISFGVETGRTKSAEEAMKELSDKMNAIVDAVKSTGIEEKDIRTESLRMNPSYDWDDGKKIDQGFEAHQSLRVKIRVIDKVGTVLSAATAAGANQAGGVSFTIDDPDELQRQAREEAIEDAQQKARILAKDLGVSLGKLKGYSEGGNYPMPMYARAEMMMDSDGYGGAGAPPPVPAGEQEVHATVTLMYEVR